MRSVRVHAFGDESGVSVDELPIPEPGAGEVRLRVAGAAVNRTDINLRLGKYGLPEPDPTGHTVGMDVSGVVDALGAGVDGLAVGDAVIAFAGPPNAPGTQAEYVVLPVETIAPAPASAEIVRAGTLPLNGLTAIQALRTPDLPVGGRVLVTGAAGGLGMFLVQLARHEGHEVIAWVKDDADGAYVQRFGAGTVITAADQLEPASVDAVLDAATLAQPTIGLIKDGGIYINFRGVTPELERDITNRHVIVANDQAQLRELVALVDAGDIELPEVERVPLADVADAQRRLAAGGIRDRLVLVP
ncbi:MAG: NADPH:quinone reductase [Conexibacter sp.]|nr:NADPH:quinone reductase [Conexibacter sp.]